MFTMHAYTFSVKLGVMRETYGEQELTAEL